MKTILFLCTSTLFHAVSIGTLIFGNASFLFQNKSVQSGLGSIEMEIVILGQEGKTTKNYKMSDKRYAVKERIFDYPDDLREFLKSSDKLGERTIVKPAVPAEIFGERHSQKLDPENQMNMVERFEKNKETDSKKMRIVPLIVPAPKDSGAVLQENFYNTSGNPSPCYPKMAILKGWEGETVVRISVDSSGGIESFEMLQSSGFSTLDEAVLKVLPQWHFEKGRARVMDVPFKFLLKSEK